MTAQKTGDVPSMRRFFAYRLAVLADEVSQAMARLYADRFSLTRNEWRVVAALADLGATTARDVGLYSTLDKMQVSRALQGLETRNLVTRGAGADDRRTKAVELSEAGHALYAAIAPLLADREAALLATFTDAERHSLDEAVQRLTVRARNFVRDEGG